MAIRERAYRDGRGLSYTIALRRCRGYNRWHCDLVSRVTSGGAHDMDPAEATPFSRPSFSRRAVLRAGALTWLGFGITDLLLGRARSAPLSGPRRRAIRGVILAFCPGAQIGRA